jgi:Ca2+-binding EF-hand superfamily protein
VRQTGRWLIAAACLLPGGLFADETRTTGDKVEIPSSGVNAVVFSAPRPMFLRLSIRVDGKSLNQFRRRFAEKWFWRLDHDKHGSLSPSEIAEFKKLATNPAEAGKPAIPNAKAGAKTSLAEFRALVDRQLGPPLSLVSLKQPAAIGMTLFRQLDLNRDGVLTQDELRRARQSLAHLDADDDETISAAEVTSAEPYPRVEEAAEAENQPIAIATPATAERIAQRLLRAYSSAPDQRDAAISLGDLSIAQEAFRPFDRDHDGKLTAPELARMLCEMPVQAEVAFQLFEQDRGTPTVSVAVVPGALRLVQKQDSADSCTLETSGLVLTFGAKRTRGATGDRRSFYALRFKLIDKDKNGYLDAKEFPSLGLPQADFKAVDRDHDGKITQSELLDFLGSERPAVVNRVVLSVSDDSRSLFDFLDTRPDGRLSPRELNAASERLRELDRNHDGRITIPDLLTRLTVEAEVGNPPEPTRNLLMVPQAQQRPPAVPPEVGPEWFRRMDRNYDGDVSRREFIGPRAVFDRLDLDHDGLLSPEEAAQAK